MHLRTTETIQKIYRRHYLPYIFSVMKMLMASFAFFFVAFLLQESISRQAFIWTLIVIIIIFIGVFLYLSFVYWSDKLVVTNHRVIFVNWKLLNVSEESEAELHDIQDIHIVEKGLLAHIPLFDYGTLTVSTAASDLAVQFLDAPDPDTIKQFIFSVKE